MNIQGSPEGGAQESFQEKTVTLMRSRKNQELRGPWESISNLTKCLFFCFNPCLNYSEVVDRNHEYIVIRGGIPTKIIREQGVQAGYGEVKKIDNRIYTVIIPQQVNDKLGMPYRVEVSLRYHITNSLQATYQSRDYHSYVKKSSKEAIFAVLTRTNRDNWTSRDVELRLKHELQQEIEKVGVSVYRIFVQKAVYKTELQRQLMVKQAADSYILAQKAICEGAFRNLKELLEAFSQQGIELSDAEIKLLIIKMIQQNALKPNSIDFYEVDSNPVIDPLIPGTLTMNK